MAGTVDPVEAPPPFSLESLPPFEEMEFQLRRVQARDLAAKDVGGKSDPYIVVGFIGDEDVVLDKKKDSHADGGIFFKSEVTKKSLSFELGVEKLPQEKFKLKPFKIEIWDKDKIGKSDWMGSKIFKPEELIDAWFSACVTWRRLADTTQDLCTDVEQGVKSGKVTGSLLCRVKITHEKLEQYAQMEMDYAVYQKKVRDAEEKEKKRVEEGKRKEREKKKEEERLKKKAKEDKQKQARIEEHKKLIPGQFSEVKCPESLLKFLKECTDANSWTFFSCPWKAMSSTLRKSEVLEMVGGSAEIFRVIGFVLEIHASDDLVVPAVGFLFGLAKIVDFSEMADISKLMGKLFGWIQKGDASTPDKLKKINETILEKMPGDEKLLEIKKHFKVEIFTAAEQAKIDLGFTPEQAWDSDLEPFNRMIGIVYNHLDNFLPEHEKLLWDLIVYLRTKCRANMGKSDFWDDVARACMSLEKKNHPGIDKAMKNMDAFLVVDGIGVNYRVLHIFKKELLPLKTIYDRGGRWHFAGAKPYTNGGWSYIKE